MGEVNARLQHFEVDNTNLEKSGLSRREYEVLELIAAGIGISLDDLVK
jgi:ATP/maltotriose-dependent transcriptional regulator MalT